MKYIRTKDGIYEKNKLIYAFNDNEEYLIKDIIKQANTIKELCDEFVIKDAKGRFGLIENDLPLAYFYDLGDEVYGAIWTDKGLVYVAKMNEKGELELL